MCVPDWKINSKNVWKQPTTNWVFFRHGLVLFDAIPPNAENISLKNLQWVLWTKKNMKNLNGLQHHYFQPTMYLSLDDDFVLLIHVLPLEMNKKKQQKSAKLFWKYVEQASRAYIFSVVFDDPSKRIASFIKCQIKESQKIVLSSKEILAALIQKYHALFYTIIIILDIVYYPRNHIDFKTIVVNLSFILLHQKSIIQYSIIHVNPCTVRFCIPVKCSRVVDFQNPMTQWNLAGVYKM